MSPRLYAYVGPEEIRQRAIRASGGTPIHSFAELQRWLRSPVPEDGEGLLGATYVVSIEGVLVLADRRSEHVACASGQPVLAAGELFFRMDETPRVEAVSNLSTGYCPEAECWPSVAAALDRAGLEHPASFTAEFIFRRCTGCGERNL